jgi:formate dehydrogenase major subunit
MTNHWVDLQNSKVFLIAGSNAAENHVMSMKWVRKAQERGAKIIHVDPRFNRTSSAADIFARVRPGADIAYLGAIIRYLLEERLYDEAYVRENTNALFLTRDDYAFEDGLFSGYDAEKHKYDNASWGYQLDPATNLPRRADSLDDPRCVLQRLRQHFARYTFEKAEEISGIPAAQVKLIADTLVENRPGTIMYALGMTQHTTGVQGIRCYPIIQLLLGNIGVPGGGVNALRGEPNVQGACDMSVLYNYFAGYTAQPDHDLPTLAAYTRKYGTFRAKFVVNALKAWFGDAATPENDFGYGWLMKKNGARNYSVFRMFETALEGKMKLLYVMGQNPLVTNPNLKVVQAALASLDMLVVQDLWETETAAFWQAPGVDAKAIQTEVVLLPAAYFMEKDGTITGSGRMVQWRHAAVKPPGDAKSDLEIVDALFRKVRDLYRDSAEEKDQIIKRAVWAYSAEHRYEDVLKEINGSVQADVTLKDGKVLKKGDLVGGIGELQADGSTSSGSWIYAGVFKGGKNLSKRRDAKTDPSGLGIYPGFAWSWPGNMHVLYNRASCDAAGKPRPGVKPIVWWDEAQKKWTGHDTPDVPVPTDGPDTENGQRPFRMAAEGVGRLFAAPYKHPDVALKKARNEDLPRDSSGVLADGPLPEFYEPVESPVANALHPAVQSNPVLRYPRVKGLQPIGTAKEFPYVLMTSSVSEHWCAGSTTRNVPWLNELVPEPVVELPEPLAAKLGLRTGDRARVSSARGEVEVKAVVTRRMQVMRIAGQEVPVVWMPYNWGFKGLSTGPSTNHLTIDVGDPNTWCQETKACLVNVVPAAQAVASKAAPAAGKGA